MEHPHVSVVIPTYNAAQFIQVAIESILAQTFSDFEVIVADGDSTDGTAAAVEMLAARDVRVHLDRQQRTGIVDGRNRGATLARGQYLAWLDADDVALPYRLERQVQFMDTHADVAAVGGTIVVGDENLQPLITVRYPTQPARIAASLPEGNVLAASAAMIRTSAYRAVGGCRGPFKQGAEDYDLWLRLCERYRLANLPDLLAYYRTHSGQVSSTGIERFVIPTVAAQLSARARREGRADVYGEADVFSYELFRRLEPNSARVDRAILAATASQSIFLAFIGELDAADKLLTWAEHITAHGSPPRQSRARTRLARAILTWKSGQLATAALLGGQAALLDPGRMAGMLLKGVRARLPVR
jgi:glycosyltransferase involved in cell wall biosynthesis